MSDDGRLTGLVGDFGLGLTKPTPEIVEGDIWIGGGFRALVDGVCFCDTAGVEDFLGVTVDAGFLEAVAEAEDEAALGAFGSLGEGVVARLVAAGDFVPDLEGLDTVRLFERAVVVVVAVDFTSCLGAVSGAFFTAGATLAEAALRFGAFSFVLGAGVGTGAGDGLGFSVTFSTGFVACLGAAFCVAAPLLVGAGSKTAGVGD